MPNRRGFLCGCFSCGVAALSRPVQAGWRPRPAASELTRAHNDRLFLEISESASEIPWEWIVVHHTAAEYATLAGIDRYHRSHFGDPLGAEYHFIVGNGRKSPAGLVQAARWRHSAPAAHLFRPQRAPNSLAICLIGNFENRFPSGAEMEALDKLTLTLMDRFLIPVERVTTHRTVDGRLTQCPGKHFPTGDFLRRLGSVG